MQGPFLRQYGVAAAFVFHLYEIDGVDFRVDASHASGDTTLTKNEGVPASTANAFVDEGKGYSITLTATEMQVARGVLEIVDQTATKVWLDEALVFETYGHASAQHENFPVDISVGDIFSQIVTNGTVNNTLLEILEVLAAVLRGTTAGSGTLTEKFKSPDGETDVLVVNYDASGDRTSVELNVGP